jgi:hypothetical protein
MLEPGDIVPEALNFSNFQMNMFGFNLMKFLDFELDYEAEWSVNYGKDGHPISWTVKKFKNTLKATLLVEELKNFIPLAPGGNLLMLPPGPITASTIVPNVGSLKITIPAAKIIKYPFKAKEGDDKMEIPMDLGVASMPIIEFT